MTQTYREEFIRTYDRLFATFQSEFDQYAYHSERMREHFARQRRRFPLLHRSGKTYLVSPGSERLQRVDVSHLPRFGVYRGIMSLSEGHRFGRCEGAFFSDRHLHRTQVPVRVSISRIRDSSLRSE